MKNIINNCDKSIIVGLIIIYNNETDNSHANVYVINNITRTFVRFEPHAIILNNKILDENINKYINQLFIEDYDIVEKYIALSDIYYCPIQIKECVNLLKSLISNFSNFGFFIELPIYL